MPDYDDMRDWQYREENPGYEREVGLTAGDLTDCEPDIAEMVVGIYAHDNARRREHNTRTREAALQARVEELAALLKANDIPVPAEDD